MDRQVTFWTEGRPLSARAFPPPVFNRSHDANLLFAFLFESIEFLSQDPITLLQEFELRLQLSRRNGIRRWTLGLGPSDSVSMLHVVLVEPEIPPNTGNIARLCLAARARLHLIEPLGFSLDEKSLRRAGMDYWHECDIVRWPSFEALNTAAGSARFFFFTTKSDRPYWSASFQDEDHLVFGRETKGLPESLLSAHTDQCLTIPMEPTARSLNLATAAGIVLYEAKRQLTVR
jgi:tRNA (cytidine/uridine-2'-O-)-methyltransferase